MLRPLDGSRQVLPELKMLERVEAVRLYCKPHKYRTPDEQELLEFLVETGNSHVVK